MTNCRLPWRPLGGAGEKLSALVSSDWFKAADKDRSVCQIGQLKTMAAPFYDRLRELNIEAGNKVTGGWLYPWTEEPEDDSDLSPAMTGQLKRLFSFDLDGDKDGLPDWWEARVFSTYEFGARDDTDGDGVSNGEEFRANTDANLADGGGDVLKPVVRAEGLEVYGSMKPVNRLLASENAVRKALGLPGFASAEARKTALRSGSGEPDKPVTAPEAGENE